MIIAWMLAVAVSAQSDLVVQSRTRREAGGCELAIAGKARGFPDGTVVTLRFRRMANRADWTSKEIVTGPLDPSWVRCVSLERGAFHLRERLDPPGDVEVEFVLASQGVEDGPPALRQVFHGASVAERIRSLRADAKRMDRAIDEAAAQRRPREKVPSGELTATADLLDLFLSDVERLRDAPPRGAVALSSITGGPLSVAGQRETLEWIGEIARRERRLVIVGELRRVTQEILSLAASGEPRKWSRALPGLEKSLQALEEAVREERSDDLNALTADLEMLFNLAPTIVDCPAAAGPEWEKLIPETVHAGATLEASLRKPIP
jgi:hypothetical protein